MFYFMFVFQTYYLDLKKNTLNLTERVHFVFFYISAFVNRQVNST